MATIVGVIESLGAGGAERQFCYVMRNLSESGYKVAVITYRQFPTSDFYQDLLTSANIEHIQVPESGRWKRMKTIVGLVKEHNANLLIGFLPSGILQSALASRWLGLPLICSERSIDTKSSGKFWIRMLVLSLSSNVVTNSQTQLDFICRHAPWLRSRALLIRNAFVPPAIKPDAIATRDIDFVSVATYSKHKNVMRSVSAFHQLTENHPTPIKYHWFGHTGAPNHDQIFRQACTYVKKNNLVAHLTLNGPTTQPMTEMARARFFVLPSTVEGFPNALIEACFAGAVPIVSKVSDIPILVKDGETGFLFDPLDVQSITRSMSAALAMSESERAAMATRARQTAEGLFDPLIVRENWLKLTGQVLREIG